MSTYVSEDLALAGSLIGISIAMFALFLSSLSGLGVAAGLIAGLIILGYFLVTSLLVFPGRRAAAAAAEVIAFRGTSLTRRPDDATPAPAGPRFALVSVTVHRRPLLDEAHTSVPNSF
ncbi:hypothetical protein I8D64_09050 [Brachybacterium sp. MASK1Z-5]|uniref:Uncharacterized protein n=1 Tax=Brachybacterium halotolerans TaxID=2795215 RepID=A0ABS1BA56_9MICO|nr:hypothetical protein [Brachybacterium halotolerans]MBK0331549.1 hypothetical protein [Brachybacterium halotolerans]